MVWLKLPQLPQDARAVQDRDAMATGATHLEMCVGTNVTSPCSWSGPLSWRKCIDLRCSAPKGKHPMGTFCRYSIFSDMYTKNTNNSHENSAHWVNRLNQNNRIAEFTPDIIYPVEILRVGIWFCRAHSGPNCSIYTPTFPDSPCFTQILFFSPFFSLLLPDDPSQSILLSRQNSIAPMPVEGLDD